MVNRATQSISYVVGKAFRGRGVATASVQLALADPAVKLGTNVWLEIEDDNEPSKAVARRCGFVRADLPSETVEDKGRTYVLETWRRSIQNPATA